jgi:hypothetical protein
VQAWRYPKNVPKRDYQFEVCDVPCALKLTASRLFRAQIVRKALFRNTLVCLPTGLVM